jgi:hypothetical protein
MRPVIARVAKRSSRGGSSRRRIGPRARASAGRPYPAVNCEIDGAPALFPLIAPLVLGEVSSGHHAASPYLTGRRMSASLRSRPQSAPQRNAQNADCCAAGFRSGL